MRKKKKEDLRVRATECRLRPEGEAVTVEATVHNDGTEPVYVTTQPRRVEYDPATRALTVWFSDRQGAPDPNDPVRKDHTVPTFDVVEPGGSRTLSASLPPRLVRLVALDRERFDFETLPVAEAQSLTVHVAVSDTPFYFNPSRPDLPAQLAGWGQDVSASGRRQRQRKKPEAAEGA